MSRVKGAGWLGALAIALLLFLLAGCGGSEEKAADPLFAKQWALADPSSGKPGFGINAPAMWAEYGSAKRPRDVIVAVIDSGVDFTHEDLKGAEWVNEGEIEGDGTDNDKNGYVDDVNGHDFLAEENDETPNGRADPHGTMCAGIIAARHNDVGIAGVARFSNIKIMSLKILDSRKSAVPRGSEKNLLRAIKYADKMGADICNLSVSSKKKMPLVKKAMSKSDMLFVVSAGNGSGLLGGMNIDKSPVYPASYRLRNAICVANSDASGSLNKTSNYGKKTVDLAAPGTDIITAAPGDEYVYDDGASLAVSHVSGVAALIYAIHKSATPESVKRTITESVVKTNALTRKTRSGGILSGSEVFG